MNRARRLRWWLPALAWMALLYALSSRPALPGADLVWDKLAHAAAYAVLGVLCLAGVFSGLDWPAGGGARAVLAAAVALLYGLADEVHQAFVPGRQASVADWLADAVGVGLAVVAFHAAGPRLGRRTARGSSGREAKDNRVDDNARGV